MSDSIGEEAFFEPGSFASYGLVPSVRMQKVEQTVVGVGGVFSDPLGFCQTAAAGDNLNGSVRGTNDPCGSPHHFLQVLPI